VESGEASEDSLASLRRSWRRFLWECLLCGLDANNEQREFGLEQFLPFTTDFGFQPYGRPRIKTF
jgi:hypothetical protein